jgi:hypothetical protein
MSRFVYIDRSKLDDQKRKLENRFAKKLSEMKADATEKTIRVSTYVAQALAIETFPSANAIGLAVAAVRWDVNQVYITAGKAFEILRETAGPSIAGAFYSAIKKQNTSKAIQILRASGSRIAQIQIGTLDPDLHEKARDRNGRVTLANPLQIVSAEELDAFVKHTVARLGKTASGWNACAEKLGGDGNVIAWKGTAVHGNDGGTVQVRHDKTGVRYILKNNRPLTKKLISPGQVASIVSEGRKMLTRLLAEK